jgi:hypothetical protein
MVPELLNSTKSPADEEGEEETGGRGNWNAEGDGQEKAALLLKG